MYEGLEGGGVINVVIERDNAQDSRAVMDVGDEEARVATKIMPDNTAPRDKLLLADTRVPTSMVGFSNCIPLEFSSLEINNL